MAKQTLSNIIRGKHYYRNKFRSTVVLLILSLTIMASLSLFIFYEELTQPTPNFYASNSAGAGFITQLTPLSEPNQTSQYLLAPDPPEEMNIKSIDTETQTPTTSPGDNAAPQSPQAQPPAQTGTGTPPTTSPGDNAAPQSPQAPSPAQTGTGTTPTTNPGGNPTPQSPIAPQPPAQGETNGQ